MANSEDSGDLPAVTEPVQEREASGHSDEGQWSAAARIRTLAVIALVLGTVLLWLSFVNVRVTDREYRVHFERAIPIEHLLWIIAAMIPAGWVMREPRKKRIFIWAFVYVSASIAMGLLTWRLDGNESVDPGWPRFAAMLAWLTIGVLLATMIEVRLRNRESPPLPSARIHHE